MMRKVVFLLAMLLTGMASALAQDTIILRSGDMLEVQVREVSDTDLRYTLWAEPDGPTYVKRVADIFMVRYKSGRREVYGAESTGNIGVGKAQKTIGKFRLGGEMRRGGGNLYVGDCCLMEKEVLDIFGEKGLETYMSAKKQYSAGGVNFTMGILEAFIGAVVLYNGYNSSDGIKPKQVAIGVLLCVVADIQLPLGFVFNGIGKGRLNWLVNEYNAANSVAERVSFGVAPALVCTPGLGGSGTIAPGVGLSLRF